MTRKRGKSKVQQAVPDEILAEGSEGTPVHVQADESGTELHVSADEVEADVAEVLAPPRVKSRKARAGKPAMIEAAEEAVADASDEAVAGATADDGHVAEAFAAIVEDGTESVIERAAGDEGDALDDETADHAAEDDGALFAAGDSGGDPSGSEVDEVDDVGEVGAGADEIAAVMPTSAASLDAKTLRHLVEALVFAADKPITVQRLRQLTRVADVGRLEAALAELAVDYQDRGVILQQVSGGYQFRTQTRFSAWVQQLIQGRPVRLSRAQLETLAIVAYRQPITRPEIDDIRGVDSSATLKLLLDRALIRILGKREEVGRPMLYGTTREFLDFFSLGDLRELPTLREYSELTDESRKVMKDRLGGGEPEGGSTPPSSDDGGGAPPPADDGGTEPASASEYGAAASVDDARSSVDASSDDDGPRVDVNASGDVGDHASTSVSGDVNASGDVGEHAHVNASGEDGGHSNASGDVGDHANWNASGEEDAHIQPSASGEIGHHAHIDATVDVEAHDQRTASGEGEDAPVDEVAGAVEGADAHWPQGSMRMAAVTPLMELVPKAEVPVVDAHVVRVLEGVAADSGEPTQE